MTDETPNVPAEMALEPLTDSRPAAVPTALPEARRP